MFLSTIELAGQKQVVSVSPDARTIATYGVHPKTGRQLEMLDIITDQDACIDACLSTENGMRLSDAKLLAPIPIPKRNILCVGKNYRSHAEEFGASGFDKSASSSASNIPQAPIVFTKASNCVIGDSDPIKVPFGLSHQVDYEAELAVVIGRGGRGISQDDAYSHVFGYTIVNDVTARDLQAKHEQWFLGKSIDTFCPMGPWIVTADSVDAENLPIRCWVNGELRQNANTQDLLFNIPNLIETISASMTLEPGDIIATGTPEGVGIGFSPPKFLKDGDEIVTEIEGIGKITNRIYWSDGE